MNRIVVPIALLILLPIFGLAAPFFISGIGGNSDLEAIGTLSHLWNYVLGAYISSTLILVLGVGLGIFILGVGNAWIIASYEFPGKKVSPAKAALARITNTVNNLYSALRKAKAPS